MYDLRNGPFAEEQKIPLWVLLNLQRASQLYLHYLEKGDDGLLDSGEYLIDNVQEALNYVLEQSLAEIKQPQNRDSQ